MIYVGSFEIRGDKYSVSVCEEMTSTRYDFFNGDIKFNNPTPKDIVASVYEDLKSVTKECYGNVDVYYAFERIMREARQFRFNEADIESYDDFDDGEVVYVCNQKTDRFEYNYKTINGERAYRYMRTPESVLELSIDSETRVSNKKHMSLTYMKLETDKSAFNEDSLVLSRIATVSELREKYDLRWLSGKEYIWMDDIFQLQRYLKEYERHALENPDDAELAIDTETTGLNYYHYPHGSQDKDKLVSIVLSWKENFSIYIPVGHLYEKNIPEDYVIKILTPYIKKTPLLTQYGTFDWKVFRGYKDEKGKPLSLNIKQDFLLQNYILQPNPRAGSRSLKDKAWEILNIKQLSLSDLFPATKDKGKLEIRFELLPKELSLIYACPDVDLLRIMYKQTKTKIPDISVPIYNTEVRFMPISASGEYYGLKLKMDKFKFEKELCEELCIELESAIHKYAGYKFNLNSPDQVSDYLYNKLGCEILVASKTNPNKGSTSSKALKNLAKLQLDEPLETERFLTDFEQVIPKPDIDGVPQEPERRLILEKKKLNKLRYPTVALIVEYRNYSKLLSSFFNSIEESNRGGTLFSWINQTGAQTGRIISPLQTLPPFIKNMVVPDTSEHGFIIMDYKQVELRLMFGLAKEQQLIELSENPDNDIHRIVAALIYNMQLWEIYADLRKKSKGLNFGIPYSLGDRSLAEILYGIATSRDKIETNVARAQEDKRRFFEAMPRVERLFADAKNFVRENGVLYTLLGRGFYYESIFTETDRGKISRIMRQAGNGMIQGLGADLFKKGSTDFEERIKARGWDDIVEVYNALTGEFEGEFPKVRQAFFVHDELGNQYHKKTIHPCQVLYELRNTMQIKLPGFPTLYIGPCVVRNWGEAKEDRFEIPTALLDKWCDEVEQGMYTEPIDNPEDWIYEEIVKFKTTGYIEHLDELQNRLVKEGTPVTAENIAKIFRHDTLTHDMIAMYDDKAYENANHKKATHVELVEWAVEQYIKDTGYLSNEIKFNDVGANFDNNVVDLTNIFNSIESEIKETAKYENNVIEFARTTEKHDDRMIIMEFADELDEFSNPLDTNVDYEFDDSEDDEYTENYVQLFDGSVDLKAYQSRAEEILSSFSEYVITMARKKIITLDGVSQESVQKLTAYLQQCHTEDGLYTVAINYGGQVKDTAIKVDKIDEVAIDMMLTDDKEQLWENTK